MRFLSLLYTHTHKHTSTHTHTQTRTFVCETWLNHMWDMTHSHLRHDPFTRATWHILTWNMIHSHLWHDSLTYVAERFWAGAQEAAAGRSGGARLIWDSWSHCTFEFAHPARTLPPPHCAGLLESQRSLLTRIRLFYRSFLVCLGLFRYIYISIETSFESVGHFVQLNMRALPGAQEHLCAQMRKCIWICDPHRLVIAQVYLKLEVSFDVYRSIGICIGLYWFAKVCVVGLFSYALVAFVESLLVCVGLFCGSLLVFMGLYWNLIWDSLTCCAFKFARPPQTYEVATVSRIDKIIGLFCKRDL